MSSLEHALATLIGEKASTNAECKRLVDALAEVVEQLEVSYDLQPVPLTVHHYGEVRVITLTCSICAADAEGALVAVPLGRRGRGGDD